jgi:hypothetical protein
MSAPNTGKKIAIVFIVKILRLCASAGQKATFAGK